MKSLLKTNQLGIFMLFCTIILLWVTMAFVIGPPDEAPPFIAPNP